MLKARFLFVSLKLAAKVTVKELFTNLDRFGCGSSSVVSSGRKVLNCSLPLDEFGTSCHFHQGGKTLFIIAQLDVLFDFPPLDEFGTSCCLLTLFAFDRST